MCGPDKREVRFLLGCIFAALMSPFVTGSAKAAECAELARASLPHMTIESATEVPAGSLTNLSGIRKEVVPSMPSFCRVVASSHPVPDSNIGFEVWLPASGWTGRMIGAGGGGLAGRLPYDIMAPLLSEGAATFGTDAGHSETKEADGAVSVAWAKNPEALIDFGYRAMHEATIGAKLLVQLYYEKAPSFSYFAGCSTGGRQGVMAMQRYPDDYDGVLVGAPALDWSTQHAAQIHEAQQTLLDPTHYLSKDGLAAVKAAATKVCGRRQGVRDGLINDPLRCNFDPGVLRCKPGRSGRCLTEAQIETLRRLYKGPVNARGEAIYYGIVPGSEVELWWILGAMEDTSLNIADFRLINDDPAFNWRSLDFADQVRKSRSSVGAVIDATDTDLLPYLIHGKMIMYQGWNDPFMMPQRTIAYYEGVAALEGKRAADTMRLYMAPNVSHCGGGDGPNEFGGALQSPDSGKDPEHNMLLALEAWVEQGRVPEEIIATRSDAASGNARTKTRPLCPYPAIAQWNGRGDVNDAKNFQCTNPARERQ